MHTNVRLQLALAGFLNLFPLASAFAITVVISFSSELLQLSAQYIQCLLDTEFYILIIEIPLKLSM